MSSTNDGKDVKSNQTSSQKGKTYYIELYKTLESKLNGDTELAERTRHLCDAWRAINTLCQHATPTTHPHLLSWVLRHTARTVLQSEWQSPKSKDEHTNLKDAIDIFIQECKSAVSKRGNSQFWESQLLQRAEWFKSVLSSPWDHPVLKALLNPSGEPPSDKEVLEWLKEERSVMFVTRLRQLVASKCDDLALSLASAIMDKVRAISPLTSDVAPKDKLIDKSKGKHLPTFVDILKTQAGFNEDLWEIVTDIEFVLLHKLDRSRCIELAKQTPLDVGYKLVERLRNRLENSPREKKLWKNAKDVATVITQMLIARCMVVPLCTGVPRATLYCCTRSLVRLVSPQRLRAETYALAALAATARHLHTFAAAVDAQVRAPTCESDMKPFVCELYIRAITAGMNELERLKLKTEKESEARSTEQTLASWFTQLGDLLSPSARMKCECTLTAFSVHPSQAMYDRIKAAPVLPPVGVDTNETNVTTSEFGSWANDSQSQTNFVKTSQTLNLKHTQKQANVLSTAILTEGEAIGLGAELCQDLAVLLSGPRLKTLTWDMNRELLLENCRTYMEKTHGGTRAVTKELKYLNLDPKAFQHLPEEEEDENDIYYGIEKGYEHLVEITQEPEEIWQDTLLEPDKEVSSCSSSIEEYPIRRKKKSKKYVISDEDSDPLRIADLRNCEKKRDPACNTEPKQKTKYDRDSSQEKERTNIKDKQEKNKEKKERKKWEKSEKQKLEQTANSLSSFIGMKVIKIEDGEKKVRKKKERRRKDEQIINRSTVTSITDSDYDSQGKSSLTSLNSEENESNVLIDGLFFMDELNVSEKKSGSNFRNANLSKNSELNVTNGQVALNSVPREKHKTNLSRIEAQCSRTPISKKDTSTKKVSTSFNQTLCSSGFTQVNKDVANSIKKLLQFRRQMNKASERRKVADCQSNKTENREKQLKQVTHMNTGVEYPQSKLIQKCIKLSDTSKEKCDSSRNIFTNTFPTSSDVTKSTTRFTEKTTPTPRVPYLGQCVRKEVIKVPDTSTTGKKMYEQLKYPIKITNKSDLNSGKATGILKQHGDNTSMHSLKVEPSLTKSKTATPVITKSQQNSFIKKVYHQNSFFQTKDNLEQVHYQPQGDIKTYTKITPTSQQSYQDYFIKQLQGNLDITVTPETVTNTPVSKNKESKPVHTQLSFASNLIKKRAEIVIPRCAQQNKLDVAPNTFARLSYMHKSKQSENKEKLTNKVLDSTPLNLKLGKEAELNQHIKDHTFFKMQYLQREGLAISRLEGSIPMESKDAECLGSDLNQSSKHTLVEENPILCNILDKKLNEPANRNDSNQTTVKPPVQTSHNLLKNTSLSEKDQQELILLLRQQSKLNAPVSLMNTANKNPMHTQSASLLKTSIINNIVPNNPADYKNKAGGKCQQSQVKVVHNNDIQNSAILNANLKTPNSLNTSKPYQSNKMADIPQNMSKKLEKNTNVTIKHMPHATKCLTEPILNNANVKCENVKQVHSVNKEQILSKCQNNHILTPICHPLIEVPKNISKYSPRILNQTDITRNTNVSSNVMKDSLENDTKAPSQQRAKYSNSKHQDWEKVMNAILAQKTPCRSGPSELEMTLRKDAQGKRIANKASESNHSSRKTVSDKEIKKPLNEIPYVEKKAVTETKILPHKQSCRMNPKNMLEKQTRNENVPAPTTVSVKEARQQLSKHGEDSPSSKLENKMQTISQKSQFPQNTIERNICLQNPEITTNTDINKHIVTTEDISSPKPTKKVILGADHRDYLKQKNQTNFAKRLSPLGISPLESKKKQFIPEMLKESDPFISGIPNSDYDLLEELMDDDLRQEIGELSSDEETYRSSSASTLQNRNSIISPTDKMPSVNKSLINNLKCTLNDKCKQSNKMKKIPLMETSKLECNSQLKKDSEYSMNISKRKPQIDYFEKIPKTVCDIVHNTNVTHNINKNNTLLCNTKDVGIDKRSNLIEPAKLFITSVPRQSSLQNVVLIGSDVVYNPCSIQIQEVPVNANLFVNQNAFVAVNNTPNLTLFQTTQLTTTTVNPVIVRNTITVPMKCSNVSSSIGSDIYKLPSTKKHDVTLSTKVMAQETREILKESDSSQINDASNKPAKEQSCNVIQDKISKESLLVLDNIKAKLSNVSQKAQESITQSTACKTHTGVNNPLMQSSKKLPHNVENVTNVRNQCIDNNKLQKEGPIVQNTERNVPSNRLVHKPVVVTSKANSEHVIDDLMDSKLPSVNLQQDQLKIENSTTLQVNLQNKCDQFLISPLPYSKHSYIENTYSKSSNASTPLLASNKKTISEEYCSINRLAHKSAVVTSKKISEHGIVDLMDCEQLSSGLQQDNLKNEKSIPLEMNSSNKCEHSFISSEPHTLLSISKENDYSESSNAYIPVLDSKKKNINENYSPSIPQVHKFGTVKSKKKSEHDIVNLEDCEKYSGNLHQTEKSKPFALNSSNKCEHPLISPALHTRHSISNENVYSKSSSVNITLLDSNKKTITEEYGQSIQQVHKSAVVTSKKISEHGIVDLVDCKQSSGNLQQDNLKNEKSMPLEMNSSNECKHSLISSAPHTRLSISKENVYTKSSNGNVLDSNKKTITKEYGPNIGQLHKSAVVTSKNISEHGVVDVVNCETSSGHLKQDNLKIEKNKTLELNSTNKCEHPLFSPAPHTSHSKENDYSKSSTVGLPLLDSNKKTIASEDAIRLQNKRFYIMNRVVNTPSSHPPIQLSYMPLAKKTEQNISEKHEKIINYDEDDIKMKATYNRVSLSVTEDDQKISDLTKYKTVKLESLAGNKNQNLRIDVKNISQSENNSIKSFIEIDNLVTDKETTSLTKSNTQNTHITKDDHKNKTCSFKSLTDVSLNPILITDGEILAEVKENKHKEDDLECVAEKSFRNKTDTLVNENISKKTLIDAKQVDSECNNKEKEEEKPELRRIFLRSASKGEHNKVEKLKNGDIQKAKDCGSMITNLDTKECDISERRTSKRILTKKINKSGDNSVATTDNVSSLNINIPSKETGIQGTLDCTNKVSISDTCLIDIEDEIQSSKILKSIKSNEVAQQTKATETDGQSKRTKKLVTNKNVKDISVVKAKSKHKSKNKPKLAKKTNDSFMSCKTESSNLSTGELDETKQFIKSKKANYDSGSNNNEKCKKVLDVENMYYKANAHETSENLKEHCLNEITVDKVNVHDVKIITVINKSNQNKLDVISMVESNDSETKPIKQAANIAENISIKEKEHRVIDEPAIKKDAVSIHIPKENQTVVTRQEVKATSTLSINEPKLNKKIVKKLTAKDGVSSETIFCKDDENLTITEPLKLSRCDSGNYDYDSNGSTEKCTKAINIEYKDCKVKVSKGIDDSGSNDNEKCRKALNVEHMDKTVNTCESVNKKLKEMCANEMRENKLSVNDNLNTTESKEMLVGTDGKQSCTSFTCTQSRKRTSARNIAKKATIKEKEHKVSDDSVLRKDEVCSHKPVDNKTVKVTTQDVNDISDVKATSKVLRNKPKLETIVAKNPNTNGTFQNSETIFCKDNVNKKSTLTDSSQSSKCGSKKILNDHGSKDNNVKSGDPLNVGDISEICINDVAAGKLDVKDEGSVRKALESVKTLIVGTKETSVTTDERLTRASVKYTKSKKRLRNVKKKSLKEKDREINNEPVVMESEVCSHVSKENETVNVLSTDNLSPSVADKNSTEHIKNTRQNLSSHCDFTKDNVTEVIDLLDDEVLPKETNTVNPNNRSCRRISKGAKHKTRHKTKVDKFKCHQSNDSDLKNIRDSIKIQELPTQVADPLKRIILIQLPDGKTFKASVFGKLDINFDTLFADPQMKSILLNSIKGRKRYTLNIKQTSLHSNANNTNEPVSEQTKLPQPESIDTVDLISDDENEPTKSLTTDDHSTISSDNGAFTNLQNRLGQKSSDVSDKEYTSDSSRCKERGLSENLPNIESLTQAVELLASSDNLSHNGDISSKEQQKEQLKKINYVFANHDDAKITVEDNEVRMSAFKPSSPTLKLTERKESPETKLAPSLFDLDYQKVSETKKSPFESLLSSQSTVQNNSEPISTTFLSSELKLKNYTESTFAPSTSVALTVKNDFVTCSVSKRDQIPMHDLQLQSLETTSLRMTTQNNSEIIEIDDSSNDSVQFSNTVDNLPDKKICELKNLLLQELGIHESRQNVKEDVKEINKKQQQSKEDEKKCSDAKLIKNCFVQLIRCDGLLPKILKTTDCDKISPVNPNDEDINSSSDELSQSNMADIKSLSRSGSFSILNDFTLYDEMSLTQSNKFHMNTPSKQSVAIDLCDFTNANNTNGGSDFQLPEKATMCNMKSISETPAYGRTSPLMEILDKIVHLTTKSTVLNNIYSRNRFPNDQLACDSEWHLTKRSLCFQYTVIKRCFNQPSTEINDNSCFINVKEDIKKYNVPSLFTMMANYFANNLIIDQLINFRRTSNSPQIIRFKRKMTTGMVIGNKVPKIDCNTKRLNNSKTMVDRVGCKKKISLRPVICKSENPKFDINISKIEKMKTVQPVKPRDYLTGRRYIDVNTKSDQECSTSKSVDQNITLKVCDELNKSHWALQNKITDDNKQEPSKELELIKPCIISKNKAHKRKEISQNCNHLFKHLCDTDIKSTSVISEVPNCGVIATVKAVGFENSVYVNDTLGLNENSVVASRSTINVENVPTISISNYTDRNPDKVLLTNTTSQNECYHNVQSNILHDEQDLVSTVKAISTDHISILKNDETIHYTECTNFGSVNHSEICKQNKIVLPDEQRDTTIKESNLNQNEDVLSNKIYNVEANSSKENDQKIQCRESDTIPIINRSDDINGCDKKILTNTDAVIEEQSSDFLKNNDITFVSEDLDIKTDTTYGSKIKINENSIVSKIKKETMIPHDKFIEYNETLCNDKELNANNDNRKLTPHSFHEENKTGILKTDVHRIDMIPIKGSENSTILTKFQDECTVIKATIEQKQNYDLGLGVEMAATSIENKEKSSPLIYKYDKNVILKGVEYEDPVVGTCYVFPVIVSSDNSNSQKKKSNSDNLSIETTMKTTGNNTDVNNSSGLYEFNDCTLIPPKATYSRGSLKRKIDIKPMRGGEKKYRKGKNIDYPKFTAIAISESAYSKEYKRLLDYCSSIKFSYSQSLLKEFINVQEILTNWPINGNPAHEAPNEIDSNLFNDLERIQKYDTTDSEKLTLSEEISSNYNESDKFTTETYENISINMGFGEGSDRAIQNLEKVNDETKFSAATLSDVKQPQPFLVSENNNSLTYNRAKETNEDQIEKIRRYLAYIKLRDKVRSFFKKTTIELSYDWIKAESKDELKANKSDMKYEKSFPLELCRPDFIETSPIEAVVQVVQVGQLPVSAAAQNPVTCDPRVTQVSDVSPQFSAENSPQDESQIIKTEYTELTTADLTLPLVHEYTQQNQTIIVENQGLRNTSNEPDVPKESEIRPGMPADIIEQLTVESRNLPSLANTHSKNIHYHFDRNSVNALEPTENLEGLDKNINDTEKLLQQKKHNGSKGKTDQIAHAMNAAGITTSPENLSNSRSHTLVNILTQKIRHGVVSTGQNVNYPKVTSINAMALQQALAQILPPPLNDTNQPENNQHLQNASVTPQVLHIVQGKTNSGNQITLVDNSQPTVISTPNTAQVLHIVQNKNAVPASNGSPISQTNSFSGISLVDAGLQQGGNQLLHIVNTGNQKNNSPGQLLKRVNLLTNLTNVQGSNEQKMVQFVCKSADGKSIQLNSAHQRSMVLRLQPIDSNNLQTTSSKSVDSEDLSPTPITNSTIKENSCAQQEIKSRSVYEENYAKFIQNSSNKSVLEKSTSLPKFNQVFGKPVFQEDNQKQNDVNTNDAHMSPSNTASTENMECQPSENSVMDHIAHINSPPLLLRKSPASSSHSQCNLVQQLKQSISPMNIQTMHGGVIYTRQIPVNIGGGQTINLITVPSTELIEDSSPKQPEVKFVNQNDIEPSIIKIVPQSTPNTEVSLEEGGVAPGGVTSNENTQTSSSQPVLTQMRIKLPMLSKTPQMVPGARVIRPSFFQIQRNVIGGVNQPVYQQLVLTAAPPLGQQTIRIPHTQTNRIKVSTDNQSENQMSSSTLEQLREFDMVLEQVKERSTVQPISNSNSAYNKIHIASTDCSDGPVSMNAVSTEPTQQVLYSIGNSHSLNVAYVNRKATVTTPVTSSFVRSPDSSGMADSPTSSTHVQIHHTISADSQNEISLAKSIKVGSKSKSRPKSSGNPPNSLKINTVPTKTSNQKPLEDEQTTQRILYILAEYKEQVENSPDKDKPAPRRRSNPPSNSSGSSKRKKSSSSSKRPNTRDLSPVHGEDTCRTMGSEDSSCGTSQGECAENCLDTHSPQDSPRKVARKLTFENETQPISQPRPQPQRNVIVADGQTITVARGTAGKPATAVLMPANYILPVSMVKGGQQIAIVTNRGPKILTVGGAEGGPANTLLLQRLIGPAGLKPILTRPGVGVRHVRLPTTALHNLQTINLTTSAPSQPPDSTASPAPAATPDPVETRPVSSPWPDREQDAKQDRSSSPEGSESWNLQSSVEHRDYSYEEPRNENVDRTVLVVHKKEGTSRQHRLTHVSAAALRHKYAILEHELRLQKSLSEECEDLGVDSPSASELFPEAELLFAASPAHDHAHEHTNHSHSHTPQPTLLSQSGIPQPDIDDQIATDHLIRQTSPENREDLNVNLGLEDVGIVTVSRDGMQTTLTLDHEEFARSHPNTTFHSEPTEGDVQPFTITGLKGRTIGSTIFHHANSAPATVLMTAPQTTVISQVAPETSGIQNAVKYADINNIINSLPNAHGNQINLSSVLVKDDGLTRYDSILTDSRELHLSNTASAIVHSVGNATQVIRRVCYEDDKRERDARFLVDEPEKRDRDTRFIMDEPDAIIAGDDAKMVVEDSSREATLESMPEDDDRSSPERHAELFWESNSASEKSESRRPLDFSSDSDKCCKSPSFDETNSTDSSGVGSHMRLDSVIKEARGRGRSVSGDGSSADDTHPPLRTYPPKRMFLPMESEMGRSTSGKTRAGERSPDSIEVRRRASGRGVVKRGCHCCNGSPVPPRPKKPRQRKPIMDFSSNI